MNSLEEQFENAREAFFRQKGNDPLLKTVLDNLNTVSIINIYNNEFIDSFENNNYKLEKNFVDEMIYIYMNDVKIYEFDLSCVIATRYYYNDDNVINSIELKVNII